MSVVLGKGIAKLVIPPLLAGKAINDPQITRQNFPVKMKVILAVEFILTLKIGEKNFRALVTAILMSETDNDIFSWFEWESNGKIRIQSYKLHSPFGRSELTLKFLYQLIHEYAHSQKISKYFQLMRPFCSSLLLTDPSQSGYYQSQFFFPYFTFQVLLAARF
ncbi:unnamed protein product [Allacma fusca]|uniref:Uncharacterized protein n=1 Tax=Allacma fusca TaxID=39272 RepID=A0A8J2LC72_9HEXA|nr:unnamed protein product [Allacma fusca]